MFNFHIKRAVPARPFQLTHQDQNQIEWLSSRWDRLELPRLMYRYDVAQFVASHLKGNQGRHKEVLERIAVALPHHPSTLRTWASVPMAFAENEFHSLVHRKTKRGNRLYWTHFVLLARARDASARQQLAEQVFTEDLRTVELRERIREWEAGSWMLEHDRLSADRMVTVPFKLAAHSNAGPFVEAV